MQKLNVLENRMRSTAQVIKAVVDPEYYQTPFNVEVKSPTSRDRYRQFKMTENLRTSLL